MFNQGIKVGRENFCRRCPRKLLAYRAPVVTTSTPALAVIDGNLCRLARTGAIAATHAPLATAVLEFRVGPLRIYVREHPYGLLPGVPNLYCVDADFRLQWLAEWTLGEDRCARIVDETADTLVVESVAGTLVYLDANTGRVLRTEPRMAVAG
jgi:hypothetical protein